MIFVAMKSNPSDSYFNNPPKLSSQSSNNIFNRNDLERPLSKSELFQSKDSINKVNTLAESNSLYKSSNFTNLQHQTNEIAHQKPAELKGSKEHFQTIFKKGNSLGFFNQNIQQKSNIFINSSHNVFSPQYKNVFSKEPRQSKIMNNKPQALNIQRNNFQNLGAKHHNVFLAWPHYIKCISALQPYFCKYQLRIKYIQNVGKSTFIKQGPHSIFPNKAPNSANSLNNLNRTSQSLYVSNQRNPLEGSSNNTQIKPSEINKIPSNSNLIPNQQGLDNNLQALFPHFLLCLQTTQNMANKISNLLFQSNLSFKKEVQLAYLPFVGDFSIQPILQVMRFMKPQDLSKLNDVRIYNKYGQIRFLQPISLIYFNFNENVIISQDRIQILNKTLQSKKRLMIFRNFGLYTNLTAQQRKVMLIRMQKWMNKYNMHQLNHNKTTGDLLVGVFM